MGAIRRQELPETLKTAFQGNRIYTVKKTWDIAVLQGSLGWGPHSPNLSQATLRLVVSPQEVGEGWMQLFHVFIGMAMLALLNVMIAVFCNRHFEAQGHGVGDGQGHQSKYTGVADSAFRVDADRCKTYSSHRSQS